MTGWSLLQEQEVAEREQIAHLDDFDDAGSCDWEAIVLGERTSPCVRRAAWWVVCRSCGYRDAYCAMHMVVILSIATASPSAVCGCHGCRREAPARLFTRHFLVEPIGGL